ncbi:MAG: DUF1553 domain-containing protein [Planctomycetes bacterium]|nr:DUF1553 domain-containing protein [Planctomycetota bacterium]
MVKPSAPLSFQSDPLKLRSVQLGFIGVCLIWLLGSIAQADTGDSSLSMPSLRVVPNELIATLRYPALFSIQYVNADGTIVDVTRSDAVSIEVQDASVARPDAPKIIAMQPGTTNATIRYRDIETKATIICQADSLSTFSREVMSVLTHSGCNQGTCHGNLHGKGGFRLSLRGDDQDFDFYRLTREYGQRRIDPWEPEQSLLLRKATSQLTHQGGARFLDSSPEFEILRTWIADGAPASQSPELVSLEVVPHQALVSGIHRNAQIAVLARFQDGTVRDVTRWSRIEPSTPTGISVDEFGTVTASSSMDVSLGVTYLSGRAAARIVFLDDSQTMTQQADGLKTLPTDSRSASPEDGSILVRNPIDAIVQRQCEQLRITPQPRTDDWTLIRRLFLVTVGRLPTADESRAFVQDLEYEKVNHWVDRLLADPDFDFLWAMRWSDLIRNEEKVMSPKGTALLHDWLRSQSASDRPIREWVAELLSSTGSTFDNPPASFHRTHRDPFVAAESSTQVFLGVRMQCAKCHNHPFDVWKQDDYYGVAAYFTTIDRKQIDNKPKDELDKHIITGDEIISLLDRSPEIQHPGRSRKVPPQPLATTRRAHEVTSTPVPSDAGTESLANGSAELATPTVLNDLAQWMTHENHQFDRNMANRIWSQYFSRGIVDPPDDFRDSNPPSNPELLSFLAEQLKRSNHSLKSLSRLILTSETFARSSDGNSVQMISLDPSIYFASYPIHRLSAEVLLDAIADATGVYSEWPSDSPDVPRTARAIRMTGVPKKRGFLTTFGKPDRLLVCECERSSQVSLGQSLALVNGKEMREKLTDAKNRIDALIRSERSVPTMVEDLFLTTLCRPPSSREMDRAVQLLETATDKPQSIEDAALAITQNLTAPLYQKRRALEDLLWALLNSKEFVMLR